MEIALHKAPVPKLANADDEWVDEWCNQTDLATRKPGVKIVKLLFGRFERLICR